MMAVMPSSLVAFETQSSGNNLREVHSSLRHECVYVTGGSGFFGRAFLEWLAAANRDLELQARAIVLTRDAERFRWRLPHLAAESWLHLQLGDVRTVAAPADRCGFLVHLAGEPHGPTYASDPAGMITAMVAGAKRVLEIAQAIGVRRALLISTGAVYGPQPGCSLISEDAVARDEPAPSRRAYAQGKRQVEELFLQSGLDVVIARPFAFLGPGLHREAAFAASQFLHQALSGGPIRVLHGNVTRSYLFSTDLAEWLWTLLLRGVPGQAYNVGSEVPVTMAELARLFAEQFQPARKVEVVAAGPSDRYVPSTRKAREAFGLKETIGLEEAVRATVAWHRGITDAAPDRT
jgi:dTDP-glucose 4,6-dehydratase